MISIAKIK